MYSFLSYHGYLKPSYSDTRLLRRLFGYHVGKTKNRVEWYINCLYIILIYLQVRSGTSCEETKLSIKRDPVNSLKNRYKPVLERCWYLRVVGDRYNIIATGDYCEDCCYFLCTFRKLIFIDPKYHVFM